MQNVIRSVFILLFFILALPLTGCTILKKSDICKVKPASDVCSFCNKKKPKNGSCCCEAAICEDVREPLLETNCFESQILRTARSIEKSLGTLAAAQVAEDPPIISTGPLVTPEGGMGGSIDIDWTGPIAPLVEKIAQMTDYRVKILGNEPAIPIVVTITGRHLVIADVLQNASFQAAKRAHVLVFPSNRVIEVRYVS